MKLLTFHHYDQVRPLWRELNRTYQNGELTFDWKTHKIIWEHFYQPRNASLMIMAGIHKDGCVGIFPFISENRGEKPEWSISEDFIIGREYFCDPAVIHLFRDLLPEHRAEDMSCFYEPRFLGFFQRGAGGLVDIKETQADYLTSLKKKSRHSFRRALNLNRDIEIRVDNQMNRADISGILESQLDYWQKRARELGGDATYSRDKILTDLKIMERAEEMGKLVAMYMYLRGKMVAANFSVRRGTDRVDDYLCLRNCGEEFAHRGLGIFAILSNMEYCRELGIRMYDLSSCTAEYKRKFINTHSFYFYLAAASRTETGDEVNADRNGLFWNPSAATSACQLVSR